VLTDPRAGELSREVYRCLRELDWAGSWSRHRPAARLV